MKRIIAIILSVAAVLCAFASCGKKEEPAETTDYITKKESSLEWGNYKYAILADGTAKITGYRDSDTDAEELTMPDFINEQIKITVIGTGAFKDCQKIKYVVLPKFITKVEADAFSGSTIKNAMLMGCRNLEKIDAGAFRNCKSLVQVDLSSSVKEIGDKAFKGAQKLVVVTFRADAEKIADTAFEECGNFKIMTFGDYKVVSKFAKANGYTLEKIG